MVLPAARKGNSFFEGTVVYARQEALSSLLLNTGTGCTEKVQGPLVEVFRSLQTFLNDRLEGTLLEQGR